MIQKYLAPDSVEDWIQNPRKTHASGSVIWKAVVKYFELIGSNLTWNVGNGRRAWIGVDPWVGSNQNHILPIRMVEALREQDIIYISQLAAPGQGQRWFQSWFPTSSFGLDAIDERELGWYIGEVNRALIQIRDR